MYKKIFLSLLLIPFLMKAQEVTGNFSVSPTKISYNYLVNIPENTSDKKPLIIFLHGAGERGTDIQKVKVHGPLKYIKNNTLDAYILAPQCPENMMWDTDVLYKLIQETIKKYNIDTTKIHLTGLSMGGWGTWNLAFEHPEMFASVVPICGFVDRIPMLDACKLKDTPIQIYHGLLDDVVDVFYATEIYKRLKRCNANANLTIFADANHDSWSRVYDNPEVYTWMFQQQKK